MLAKYPTEKSIRTLVFLADSQRRAGQNEAAKATLAGAMKLDAPDSDSRVLLATVLSENGQVDDAVRILRDLDSKEPNNPAHLDALGSLLSRFGRNDEAIKVFDDMLKRFGDIEEVTKVVRPKLSVIYVNMGNYTKGEAELELLLKRSPDEPGPNNDLGYLYAEQGKNLEKAASMIRKALQEDPENFAYLDSMGWVLFKQGKLKEAMDTITRAAEQMRRLGIDPDPTIFEHLGDISFQLQEIDKAEDAWRQALKAAEHAIPPDKRVAEIRKKLDALRKLGPAPKTSTNRTP
jgi:Tfp pilus assembly protein PilF